MANWYSGAQWDKDVNEGGFRWYSALWVTVKAVRESLGARDEMSMPLALLVLLESEAIQDDTELEARYDLGTDTVTARDEMGYSTLFELADSLGIKDELDDLVVMAYLAEEADVIDDVKAMAELFASETVKAGDVTSVEVFLALAQNMGLRDLAPSLAVMLSVYESGAVSDKIRLLVELLESESFRAGDSAALNAFYELAQSFNMKDSAPELAAALLAYESVKMSDSVKMFAELIESESFRMGDAAAMEAFYQLTQGFSMEDLPLALKVLISRHDSFGMTDHEPKKAISDFLIGAFGDMDRAYDWLEPFGLRMDWSKTSIQIMPEAELTTIEMPGLDGSIVADTTYRDRLFKLVGYSVDGLTTQQKEELKGKLTAVLDATKHQTKKLTVQARGVSFDVKYSGQAEIEEGPSFVKAEIPLHTGPYGRDMFDHELEGSGLVYNEGAVEMGVTHIITGPVRVPTFTLGAVSYRYKGDVPEGCTLTVDHGMYTVYLTDPHGNKTNALKYFDGEFQLIPAGKSVALTAGENTEGHIVTRWVNRVLW